MAYGDLRQFLNVLDKQGRLHRVSREVDKSWEVAAICRHLFQTVSGSRRPALMFENIGGSTLPLLTNALGGSREIYALGLECREDEIAEKWQQALRSPLAPRFVDHGPCKEVILKKNELDLTLFPFPGLTSGEKPEPAMIAPFVCTKDPDTGNINLGSFRMQAGNRKNAKSAKKEPIPCAVVIGAEPAVGIVSASELPYGAEKYGVMGGLRGEALDLVRCETMDLAVPATAEIIIEGEIPPNGEQPTGYRAFPENHLNLNVTCITHRKNPICQAFVDQMPPSEITCIQQVNREMILLNQLRSLGLPVKDVHFPESGASSGMMAISMTKQFPGQVNQVMNAAWAFAKNLGKFTIVVDEDIDIRDMFDLEWAMSFRVQPAKDCSIVRDMPAQAPLSVPSDYPSRRMSSKIAIDATRKHAYPPIALPPKEHLEYVDRNWSKYGFK